MVSFWPFKGEDNSAASFEKSLSQLSQKITRASSKTDSFRQKQRRYKVLWTLYTSFAYILVVLILTLVTGWETWGAAEYTTVAGAPLLIYGVRSTLDAYFNYRISNSQNNLDALNKQREATIEKLKTATKYNSTQQLLDKYGGTPRKRQPSPQPGKKTRAEGAQSIQSTPQGARTGFAPPPTANIPGRQPPQGPLTPQGSPTGSLMPPQLPLQQSPGEPAGPSEEFAPNAFPVARPSSLARQSSTQYATDSPKWYDRILDVVLGEDETQARNRIVLICKNCRLVNGQAPPGARTLEDIGRWRCSNCQAWNGVDSEEKKVLKEIAGVPASPDSAISPVSAISPTMNPEPEQEDHGEDLVEPGGEFADSDIEEEATAAPGGAEETPPAGSTRSKARQRKKA